MKKFQLLQRGSTGQLTLDDYRNIPGIDWQDKLYRTAFQQNYNVSLSGGNKEGLRYNVGFSALDQDGIIIRSNFQRYQGKANFTLPITKKLTLNANANYSRTATNGVNPTTAETTSSSSGWLMYSVWGYRPVTPPGRTSSTRSRRFDGSDRLPLNPVKTGPERVSQDAGRLPQRQHGADVERSPRPDVSRPRAAT